MNVAKLLLPLVFASLAFTVNAQERSSVVQQLLPNGGDVAHTLGLDLYKFKLPVRSPQFEVILREKPTNDSEMKVIASYAFEADRGYEDFELLLSFMPEDGFAPHALFQGDDRVDMRVQCKFGNATTGSGSLIPRPLKDANGGVRSLRPMNLRADDKDQAEHELVLLLLEGEKRDGFTPFAEIAIRYLPRNSG
ncbi:hypothetical protein Pla52o_23950 [Novipirellula galeiformis]|uniref:Uncharacterized protein n=1 Tax=Novipirellula galeiformis TaxID=2528004 RepID=A0A5C6CFP9_9BACT|nr:hypothetical protein [Novipirellula galeiformis]TWU22865.1 hypothetical protein Pla52o_23950 [Novipirellula galeiformis]